MTVTAGEIEPRGCKVGVTCLYLLLLLNLMLFASSADDDIDGDDDAAVVATASADFVFVIICVLCHVVWAWCVQAKGFVTCLISCGAQACRLSSKRGGTRGSWKRQTFSRYVDELREAREGKSRCQ